MHFIPVQSSPQKLVDCISHSDCYTEHTYLWVLAAQGTHQSAQTTSTDYHTNLLTAFHIPILTSLHNEHVPVGTGCPGHSPKRSNHINRLPHQLIDCISHSHSHFVTQRTRTCGYWLPRALTKALKPHQPITTPTY